MSLILRQMAQDKLDAAGFPNLHADIDVNLHLSIKTECGKPLVSIFGITFSRKAPTIKEMEYAIELFEAFLAKHNSTITKALDLQKQLNDLVEPTHTDMEFETKYSSDTVKFIKGENTVTFKSDGTLHSHSKMDRETFNNFKITKAMWTKAEEYFDWIDTKRNLEGQKNEAWAVMNQCDI